MSLVDVQARTNGRWTAGTLSAYERGNRALRAHRLAELAELYDVAVIILVPGPAARCDRVRLPPLAINLRRLRELPSTRTAPLQWWICTMVQLEREEKAQDVVRLRRTDLYPLAQLYSIDPPLLYKRFGVWGILADPRSGPGPPSPRSRRG
jgi:transcriptional regulator with XRE-family HTH domain